jgi:hypothetical protein
MLPTRVSKHFIPQLMGACNQKATVYMLLCKQPNVLLRAGGSGMHGGMGGMPGGMGGMPGGMGGMGGMPGLFGGAYSLPFPLTATISTTPSRIYD